MNEEKRNLIFKEIQKLKIKINENSYNIKTYEKLVKETRIQLSEVAIEYNKYLEFYLFYKFKSLFGKQNKEILKERDEILDRLEDSYQNVKNTLEEYECIVRKLTQEKSYLINRFNQLENKLQTCDKLILQKN